MMRAVSVAVLLCLFAPVARGQQGQGDGSQTGDGSTAFTGLAQAPEANMLVGSAQTSIPIQVPPGRRLTPSLALQYNSNGGPSPYGYGWDLPLPRIQRSAKNGVRTCGADRDEFVLSLPSGSIECTLQADDVCLPSVEEAFVRIKASSAGGHLTWQAFDKSGIRYDFGAVAASPNGGSSFTEPARTGDTADLGSAPAVCGYGATWALTKITTPTGDTLDVQWLLEQNVLYPFFIKYGGNGSLAHKFEVGFLWESRVDQLVNGSGGVAAKLTKRLARINVKFNGAQVRAYTFAYKTPKMARETFLEDVRLRGSDDTVLARGDNAPAASTFDYHVKALGFAATEQGPARPSLGSPSNVLRWVTNNSGVHDTLRDVLDMSGDGFPDLVDTGGCASTGLWKVYRGSPAGFAAAAVNWSVPDTSMMCSLRRSTDGTGTSVVHWATMDLTGDGIPDFVDATDTPWEVYVGTPSGFGSALPGGWPAPADYVQKTKQSTIHTPGWGNWEGSVVYQDLIDMNGDGLRDLVQTPGNADGGGSGLADPLNSATWTVHPNTALGFGVPYTLTAPFQAITFTTNNGLTSANGTVYGTFDVNGDGLPDGVISQRAKSGTMNPWRVCLNSGAGIDACSHWNPPNLGGDFGRFIRGFDADQPADIMRDFIDVNGDGLPDLVDTSLWGPGADQRWKIALSRGDDFDGFTRDWPAKNGRLRDVGPAGGQTTVDTFDIDGDGTVDLIDFATNPYKIYHADGGAWAANGANVVEQPDGLRADLMVASENGIGRTTYLDYRPSTQWDNTGGNGIADLPFVVWTVTEITHDDGLCAGSACTNSGSAHTVGVQYRYEGGRYDFINRAFRGFAVVQSEQVADVTTPRRGTVTIHAQAAALAGKVLTTTTYDATGTADTKPISASINTWECANPSNGTVIACPGIPAGDVWVRLKTVQDWTYSNFIAANPKETRTDNVSWHQCGGKYYGNVREVTRGAAGGPLLRTKTEYACTTTSSTYMVDRPTHVLVSNTSGATPLEEKWFIYDTSGNVLRTESWLDQSSVASPGSCTVAQPQGGGGCVSTKTAYDAYGNITSVKDALDRETVTEYDAATQIYPVHVTQPPVSGQTSGYQVKRAHDPGCGTLLSENIPYLAGGAVSGSKTTHQYDAFCRRKKTWRPGESTSGTPYREYFYHLGAPAVPGTPASLTVASVQSREPNNGGTLLSAVLADGLGRVIQQKSESFVEGTAAYVATATRYDNLGRVSQESVPFVWTDPTPGSFLRFTEPAGAAMSATQYDAVGRPTRQTKSDGKFVTVAHEMAWQTTTLDECAQASEACAGSRTVEKRDALGRTVERIRYDEADAVKARTRFDYDELGRLIATVQGDASGWNYATLAYSSYDSLGRVVARREPDASAVDWTYGYDWVGNLRFQNDPKTGQHLEFCYDELGRMTKKFALSGDSFTNKSCTDAGTVTYTYNNTDILGLGQLLGVTDEAGSWTALQFDPLGRVLREQRSITIDGDTTVAEMKYQYDTTGDHLWKLTYPDGEIVTYSYDAAGRVNSMTGAETYLVNITYDVFGRPRKITHANTVEDERQYNRPGHRLSEIKATRGVQSPVELFRYNYASYDAAGRLKEINDLTPNKGPASELDNGAVYTYDALGRLTNANGPKIGNQSYGPHSNVLGNLDLKDGKSFTYSATKPHQPTHYDGQTVAHDSNGSRTSVFATARVFDYDKENRLIDIDIGQVRFVYDHGGRRAIMRRADGIDVRYFSPLFEASSLGTVSKYYKAGGILIAQRDETNATFAAAENGAAVRVAARSLLEPGAVVLILRRDVQIGLAFAILAGSIALVAIPPRRRSPALGGVTVHRRHALGTAALIGVATMPWPILLFPAPAGGQCGSTPIATHYHLDHLGSTQVLTGPTGHVIHHVRYMPYGEPRRFTAAFASKNADPRYRREFTGYETEIYSNLQYAGARFYDPALGMFQTHDPAREFASPYTYTNWDPVNLTDPTGACVWTLCLDVILIGAIVGGVAGATASAVQAAINGASIGEVFKAAAIGHAIGAASGAISAGLLSHVVGPTVATITGTTTTEAIKDVGLVVAIGGLGQAAYGASQGDYSGLIGFAVALGVSYGISLALSQGANGSDAAILTEGPEVVSPNPEPGASLPKTAQEQISKLNPQPRTGVQEAAARTKLAVATPEQLRAESLARGVPVDEITAFTRGETIYLPPDKGLRLGPAAHEVVVHVRDFVQGGLGAGAEYQYQTNLLQAQGLSGRALYLHHPAEVAGRAVEIRTLNRFFFTGP